jgi:hypothetical protein
MGYSMIVLIASVALFAWFIFAAKAALLMKAGVSGAFAFSFYCLFWKRDWSLAGLFLLVAVSIFIILYRVCQQARSPEK